VAKQGFSIRLLADMERLHYKCNRLRFLATCSIMTTITNKQNHIVIDYDYIKSNHDYNRDYSCLETFLERKQNSFAWFCIGESRHLRDTFYYTEPMYNTVRYFFVQIFAVCVLGL